MVHGAEFAHIALVFRQDSDSDIRHYAIMGIIFTLAATGLFLWLVTFARTSQYICVGVGFLVH